MAKIMEINVMPHPEIEKRARIYLASPFNHKFEKYRRKRRILVTSVNTILLREGYFSFSPIAHNGLSSEYLRKHNSNLDHQEWCDFDFTFLKDWADILCVLPLDGWKESVGVQKEIEYAKSIGKPIFYLEKGYVEVDKVKWKALIFLKDPSENLF